MADLATFTKQGHIGIVTLNSPPVNALSHALRVALQTAFTRAIDDSEVGAILLCCDGRTFVAGADIREFDLPPLTPDVNEIVEWVGNCPKPVTAALHGTALGGGVELALACHFRVAVPTAQLGFPEVGLGILPGAGGTQRLPRLIGVRAALDMIVGGAPIAAPKGLELGLIDELIDGDLLTGALAFVERVLAQGKPWSKVGDRNVAFDEPGFFGEYRARIAEKSRGFLAPFHCIEAIRAAVELPFAEGLKRERELFLELMRSPQSKAQRHAFFGEREVSRSPRLPRDVRPREVKSVAVVGVGETALRMAKRFAYRRLPVVVLAVPPPNGDQPHSQAPSDGVRWGETYRDLEGADLVVLTLAGEPLTRVLTELEAVCSPEAIFAFTSGDVNRPRAAAVVQRPERVLGLHFEGPSLMEVIALANTSPTACATAMNLGKVLRTVAVLERADQGSASARLRETCLREARALVAEGSSLETVNQVLSSLGQLQLEAAFDPPAASPDSLEPELGPRAIQDRCVYAMVEEGARLLDEEVVARSLEVDMIAIHGLGFPAYLGGPLFHADQVGVSSVYQALLGRRGAAQHDHRKPPTLLTKLSAERRGFYS